MSRRRLSRDFLRLPGDTRRVPLYVKCMIKNIETETGQIVAISNEPNGQPRCRGSHAPALPPVTFRSAQDPMAGSGGRRPPAGNGAPGSRYAQKASVFRLCCKIPIINLSELVRGFAIMKAARCVRAGWCGRERPVRHRLSDLETSECIK